MGDEPASSIREVLEHAAKESEAPARETPPPASEPKETPPSSTPAPAGERKGKESEAIEPRLAQKIEAQLAKLSPEERAEVLKGLKDYDRHFHKSMQKVAGFRSFAESLVQKFPGLTTTEMEEALTAKRSALASEKHELSKSLRGIDALIEKATDPSVREELRESKRVMKEEFEAVVEERLKDIREELDALKSNGAATRTADVEAEIDALEDEEGFPASFIEKYRESIKGYAVKYHLPVTEVLAKVVPYAELKAAFTEQTKGPQQRRREPPAPAPVSAPSATPAATLDRFKERRGGWDIKSALRSLVPR